jgi:hypothetical protein
MNTQSTSKIVTLGDYIRSVAEKEKRQQEPDVNINDYKVYPEDDGYDTPKNPYSPV